jgi:hypothetical protein
MLSFLNDSIYKRRMRGVTFIDWSGILFKPTVLKHFLLLQCFENDRFVSVVSILKHTRLFTYGIVWEAIIDKRVESQGYTPMFLDLLCFFMLVASPV